MPDRGIPPYPFAINPDGSTTPPAPANPVINDPLTKLDTNLYVARADGGPLSDIVMLNGGWGLKAVNNDHYPYFNGVAVTDFAAMIKFTCGPSGSYNTGMSAASNPLDPTVATKNAGINVYNNGSGSSILSITVDGVAKTNVGFANPGPKNPVWLAFRMKENNLRAEVYLADPFSATPGIVATSSYDQLSAADIANYGAGIPKKIGFRMLALSSPNLPADFHINNFLVNSLEATDF